MKWFPSRVTVAPTTEPVTVVQARRQCGLDEGDASRDAALSQFIASARTEVENECSIRLIRQTVSMQCDDFRALGFLPAAPILDPDTVEIAYVDAAGVTRAVDGDVFEVHADDLDPKITLRFGRQWPSIQPGSRVTVTAVLGFGDSGTSVPPPLISAMLLKIGMKAGMSGRDLLIRTDDVDGVGSTTYGGIVEVSTAHERAISSLLAHYQRWPLT